MLVPAACAAAVERREAAFTDGTQERDFLYVDDMVAWLELALDLRVAQDGGRGLHDHHVGSGDPVAVRTVLDLVAADVPGARFQFGALPRRAHEPPVQTVPPYRDPDPVLGSWRPTISLPEGIRRTVEWWYGQMTDQAIGAPSGSPFN